MIGHHYLVAYVDVRNRTHRVLLSARNRTDIGLANNTCAALCWYFSSPCYKTASVES